MDPEFTISPKKEKGLRETPHGLFLFSESGYFNTDMFKIIMDEFINWWTSTRPGLERYVISDNLSINKNSEMVSMTKSKGIHILNIMPRSSHWFQVHDQKPLSVPKKKIMLKKNEFLPRSYFRFSVFGPY